MNSILKLNHLARSFGKGETKLEILKDINLEIKKGEIVALVGPSGSGKSTLMLLLDNLYDVSSGSISINGVDISNIKKSLLWRFHCMCRYICFSINFFITIFYSLLKLFLPNIHII